MYKKRFPIVVLIPAHGRPKLLSRTLDSLATCDLPASYHELIVIENGSRAGAENVVASLPDRLNARYMHRERGNKSYALNEALETIPDGLIVFFDDDVRVLREILMHYASAAAQKGEKNFFGGPIDVDYESPSPEWLTPYLPGSARGWGLNGIEVESHPWFLGANWATFAEEIRNVGGFDTSVGPGEAAVGQETEIQQRLVAHGCVKVFVPGAKVWHYVPKERCSPKWALQRQYRHAVTDGLQNTEGDRLWGVPRWIPREMMRSTYMAVRDLLRGQRYDAFDSVANLYRYAGLAYGVRCAPKVVLVVRLS